MPLYNSITVPVSVAQGGTGGTNLLNYQSASHTTVVSGAANNTWVVHSTSITTPNISGSLWLLTGFLEANAGASTQALSFIQMDWSSADGTGTGSSPGLITPTFGTNACFITWPASVGPSNFCLSMPNIVIGPNIQVFLTPLLTWSGAGSGYSDFTQITAIRIQ